MVTKQMIREFLAKSDEVVVQSVCRLANKQEADEKRMRSSIYENERGFKKQHGCLVVFAEKVWNDQELSQDEIEFLRARLGVYAGQLAEMANDKQLWLPVQ